MNNLSKYVYSDIFKHTDKYIHISEVDRFRRSHPEVSLQIGAPKMYAKSWRSACEELYLLQSSELQGCNFAKMNSFTDITQGLC